jgi:hypothetical protein
LWYERLSSDFLLEKTILQQKVRFTSKEEVGPKDQSYVLVKQKEEHQQEENAKYPM